MSSIVNGTGLNHSIAGEVARFSVYLKDAFEYPSLIELEMLQVQILHEVDSQPLQPSIHPIRIVNGTILSYYLLYSVYNYLEISLI